MSPKYKEIKDDDSFKPRDFYKELAEYGLLDEFVKDRMKGKVQDDKEFKEEILKDLAEFSSEHVPQIDELYLNELKNNLSLFIKKANQCLNQKQ